jgi:hypothetical protein
LPLAPGDNKRKRDSPAIAAFTLRPLQLPMLRLLRPVALFAVLAALPLALSACAEIDQASITVTQSGGVGPVRIHFQLCTAHEGFPSGEYELCAPADHEGQGQQILAYAVPKGSSIPATITPTPGPGAPAIVFSRNQEVAERIAEQGAESEPPWPPAGDEVVGYLSNVIDEHEGDDFEWSVDADFGLPTPADGKAFAEPYEAGLGEGWREVSEEKPADRPINCEEFIFAPPEPHFYGSCSFLRETFPIPVSDLKIAPGAPVEAFAGDTVPVQFGLELGSTAASPPSFVISGTSPVPQAAVTPTEPSIAPPELDPKTHRSAPIASTLKVATPAKAKAGTYQVTLTASPPAGGKVSATAALTLVKLAIKVGKVHYKPAKGIATVSVKVPAAGTLRLSGKGVAAIKRAPEGAKTLKLTIRAKGGAKKTLRDTGQSKLKPQITFRAPLGASVSKVKSVALKFSR